MNCLVCGKNKAANVTEEGISCKMCGMQEEKSLIYSEFHFCCNTCVEIFLLIKGRNLYLQYAKTVRSELANGVFAQLANEELVHIKDIRKFIKSMSLGPAVDADRMVSSGSIDDAKRLFGKLISELKQQVKISDDERSMEIAMELDKAGYEFYKKEAESTEDPYLKKFLLWLMEQEQSHYMLIRNAFEYMNNPESWYAGEEGWLLEG